MARLNVVAFPVSLVSIVVPGHRPLSGIVVTRSKLQIPHFVRDDKRG